MDDVVVAVARSLIDDEHCAEEFAEEDNDHHGRTSDREERR
jgi:hypothetical protein